MCSPSKPSYDENSDPGEGLMNMLKKIYSEGDDEMKRTINKAWAESQEKKPRGDDFDFWVGLLTTIELTFLTYILFL